MTGDALDRDLMEAVALGDILRVSALYAAAAELAETTGETDRACFFLTHAWIFALEAGHPSASDYRARLVAHGRESET